MEITFDTPVEMKPYSRDECGPGWHLMITLNGNEVDGMRLLYVSPVRNDFVYFNSFGNMVAGKSVEEVVSSAARFLPAPPFTIKVNNSGVRRGEKS